MNRKFFVAVRLRQSLLHNVLVEAHRVNHGARDVHFTAVTAQPPNISMGADAAQICSHVGFLMVSGAIECRPTNAARQIMSEKWWDGGG